MNRICSEFYAFIRICDGWQMSGRQLEYTTHGIENRSIISSFHSNHTLDINCTSIECFGEFDKWNWNNYKSLIFDNFENIFFFQYIYL